jgi:alkylation response protein AidB-like acyl-CoA dehydrogenase
MDFALDDDQQLIVDTVRRFADRDLRAWAADADRAGVTPPRLTSTASEMGFFLDAVPAAAGGLLEGSYSHLIRALRGFELGRGCAAMASLLECNVEPALAVGKWGSDAAKQRLFAALASGKLATFINDSRGALTIAADGDGVRISGKLGPAPALATASHVLVATGDVLALVAMDTVRREAIVPSGWRAAQWGTAQLEAHRVDADDVLSRNPSAIAEVLSWARTNLAARAVGVATSSMEYADHYGKERVQFGQPIGTFEALIRLRDDALTNIAAARLLVLHAAWQIDRGLATAADTASRARVLAGDVVARTTIDAVQIFGGYGFVNDYPVEKLMRDARAFEALLGDERFGRVLSQKGA